MTGACLFFLFFFSNDLLCRIVHVWGTSYAICAESAKPNGVLVLDTYYTTVLLLGLGADRALRAFLFLILF